tara:strand:+ start:3086 stop:3913 length:828 start_codon:yes stop_codon:yes gene_type:complete
MKNGSKIELGFYEGKINNLFSEKIHNQNQEYLITKDKHAGTVYGDLQSKPWNRISSQNNSKINNDIFLEDFGRGSKLFNGIVETDEYFGFITQLDDYNYHSLFKIKNGKPNGIYLAFVVPDYISEWQNSDDAFFDDFDFVNGTNKDLINYIKSMSLLLSNTTKIIEDGSRDWPFLGSLFNKDINYRINKFCNQSTKDEYSIKSIEDYLLCDILFIWEIGYFESGKREGHFKSVSFDGKFVEHNIFKNDALTKKYRKNFTSRDIMAPQVGIEPTTN